MYVAARERIGRERKSHARCRGPTRRRTKVFTEGGRIPTRKNHSTNRHTTYGGTGKRTPRTEAAYICNHSG